MPDGEVPDRDFVMANVYLRSASGRSLREAESAALMDMEPYRAAGGNIARAINELTRRGFRVESCGLTLSISGPKQLFERQCGVTLAQCDTRVREGGSRRLWRSSRPVMHIAELDDLIEGITLAVPAAPL
ncbi:MAG TPA: hypothetical protein VEU07_13245 [Candidatus Acidoferrum sp.]|nr:hypothetical protein [Candidatus Acidoferrum sp.]